MSQQTPNRINTAIVIVIMVSIVIGVFYFINIQTAQTPIQQMYPDLKGTVVNVRTYQTNGLLENPWHQDLTISTSNGIYHITIDCTYYQVGDSIVLTYDLFSQHYIPTGLAC